MKIIIHAYVNTLFIITSHNAFTHDTAHQKKKRMQSVRPAVWVPEMSSIYLVCASRADDIYNVNVKVVFHI